MKEGLGVILGSANTRDAFLPPRKKPAQVLAFQIIARKRDRKYFIIYLCI